MAHKLGYIKSLDGIRGFFALMIVAGHWSLDLPIAPIGWEVLQIFFVLSGFLIGRILLNERNKPAYDGEGKFGGYMKSFMTKRVFRIFPLYFGYLILMYVARYGFPDVKFIANSTAELEVNGVWLWTYLYNFKDIFNHLLGWKMVESPFFTHLWSLALEEQFYVFFPFLMFFVRGKALKITLVTMIIIPIIFRIVGFPYLDSIAQANGYGNDYAIHIIYRNIFFQFDSLALGAAAAVFNVHLIKNPRTWLYGLLLIFIGATAYNGYEFMQIVYEGSTDHVAGIFKNGNQSNIWGFINILGHPEFLRDSFQYTYMFTLVNFLCFFMIVCSVQGKSILKFIFENNVFVYLGQISYGTYVFHFAFMQFFFFIVKKFAFVPPTGTYYWLQIVYFIIYMIGLYFISHLSFKYFEMYFLRLKSKMK